MPARRLQLCAEDARAGAAPGAQPGPTCPAPGDLFCLLMPSARCSDCAAPSVQNLLGFSHCLCPPTDEDEDLKGFPTLLSHQTPAGTALPVPGGKLLTSRNNSEREESGHRADPRSRYRAGPAPKLPHQQQACPRYQKNP